MNVVVVRSRRKTLSLSVNRSAEIVVRVPLRIGEEEITRFIHEHREWIKTRLSQIERIRLNLADGEKLSLFGTEYLIASGKKAAIRGNVLFLPQPDRETFLAAFMKRYAKQVMTRITLRFAEEYRFPFSAVRISSARARWGSCNRKGGISYSFRIAFLPEKVAEYVVIHELCHTLYFNHGQEFWHEVERILPDFKQRRALLKGYGDFMNLL